MIAAPLSGSSPSKLVMLCDISGGGGRCAGAGARGGSDRHGAHARAYLQFLTCAAGSGPHAEAFVFATRLTRLTRALAYRHPERAIQRAATAAPDWSSGTRIGDALNAFNDRHGRRGMARGAVVVILSDGWECGDPMLVGREMESGHSFQALGEVAEAIGAQSWGRRGPPAMLPAVETEEQEPWASATPVPGQLRRDAERARPQQGQHNPRMVDPMTTSKTCVYPGCERPAVPPHPLGGDHNPPSATPKSTTR